MKKLIIVCSFLIGAIYGANAQILISLIFGDKLNSDKLEFGLAVGGSYSTIINLENACDIQVVAQDRLKKYVSRAGVKPVEPTINSVSTSVQVQPSVGESDESDDDLIDFDEEIELPPLEPRATDDVASPEMIFPVADVECAVGSRPGVKIDENIIDTDSIDSSVVEVNQGLCDTHNNNIDIHNDATVDGGATIENNTESPDNANSILDCTDNNLISTDVMTLDDVLRSSGTRVDGHNPSRSENEVPLYQPNAVNISSPRPARSRVAPMRWGYATRGGK